MLWFYTVEFLRALCTEYLIPNNFLFRILQMTPESSLGLSQELDPTEPSQIKFYIFSLRAKKLQQFL